MKVYGKWLVIGQVNGKSRVAASFMTKRDAVTALDLIFKKTEENTWQDSLGQNFSIQKNTKEY